jgi:hypothetical protein
MHAAGNCFFIINRSIFLVAAHWRLVFAKIDGPSKLEAARLGQTICSKDIPLRPNLEAPPLRIYSVRGPDHSRSNVRQ